MKSLRRMWRINATGMIGFLLLLALVVVGVGAPLFAHQDPLHQDLLGRLLAPGKVDTLGVRHWLGTDPLGRDVWARVVYGSRVSLTVAFVAVAVAGSIGAMVGVVAGFYRGIVGAVLMRFVDIVLSIPFLLLAVATVAVLGPSFTNLVLVLGLTRWPRYARVAYAQTIACREADFVQATTALGARDGRIIVRHILPNVLPPLIVMATLEMGLMVIFESSLSFLGLGIQPPQPSWGSMLADGRNYLANAWWQTTFPGLAIMLTVLGANAAGDWIRDRLDPRSQQGMSI
jgi:peptide/nickel transport system permease protein